MEEREVSATKRQKVKLRLEDVISYKTDNNPLYGMFNILYEYLELSDVDNLLAVSHSARHVIGFSTIVEHIKYVVAKHLKELEGTEKTVNLMLLHEIYELNQSKILNTQDYTSMKQQLEEHMSLLLATLLARGSDYPTFEDKLNLYDSVGRLTKLEYTTMIFRFAKNGVIMCRQMLGRLDFTDFRRFNWNDKKLIFSAVGENEKYAISVSNLAEMAMHGEDVTTLLRLATLPRGGGWTSKHKILPLDQMIQNLKAIATIPEIVKPVMECFLFSQNCMLKDDNFVFSVEILEKIQFGEHFVKNCNPLLKYKEGMWFFVYVCKLPYFQTEKCCDLWEACSARKIHRKHMLKHTPIMKHIAKVKESKSAILLLRELKTSELDKFWNDTFPSLPLQLRADLIFEFFDATPRPSLFFCTEEEYSYTACKESHSLSLYLLQCQRLKSRKQLDKYERVRELLQNPPKI